MSNGQDGITCAAVQGQLALLLYGELMFDEEERVENHLDSCAECRAALQRERALHAVISSAEIGPSPLLLRECREDLHARVMEEPPLVRTGWWEWFTDTLARRPAGMFLRPAGALALIAVGFFGGRAGSFQAMGLAEPEASRVRNVEPASDGRVQIVLDETRQRVISGRLDDAKIRGLLLSAAKDPSDPGLRVETVDILNTRAQSAEVRDALIYALRHDQNAGVRLKAMEGLKPFTREADVRSAMSQVLLNDENPGLRTQAIDWLTGGSVADQPAADPQIINTLQELMQRGEPQDYVRERSRRALETMKASAEAY